MKSKTQLRTQPVRIVALGGGTGLSTVLRGLKEYVARRKKERVPLPISDLAAVVTVTDDGGSSGRLRREYRVLPPGDKPFKLAHERFFLYPTFDHQPGDLVRESHQPELRRALEEGVWSEGEPPLHSFVSGAPLQQPDRVRIRAWAEVTDHYTIVDPRCVDALSPFYVWTPDYAEKRLGWRGRQPLHVLLLRTYRIPRPVTVRVRGDYQGCRSWIEIARDLPFEGTPVLSDDEFDRVRDEIESICADRDRVAELV